jgi:hypothetical protein
MLKDRAAAILLPAVGLALVAVLTAGSLIDRGAAAFQVVSLMLSIAGLTGCVATLLTEHRPTNEPAGPLR